MVYDEPLCAHFLRTHKEEQKWRQGYLDEVFKQQVFCDEGWGSKPIRCTDIVSTKRQRVHRLVPRHQLALLEEGKEPILWPQIWVTTTKERERKAEDKNNGK